jgi:hypothetical protein
MENRLTDRCRRSFSSPSLTDASSPPERNRIRPKIVFEETESCSTDTGEPDSATFRFPVLFFPANQSSDDSAETLSEFSPSKAKVETFERPEKSLGRFQPSKVKAEIFDRTEKSLGRFQL